MNQSAFSRRRFLQLSGGTMLAAAAWPLWAAHDDHDAGRGRKR